MATSKAQQAPDCFRQGKRDRLRPDLDGGGSRSPAQVLEAGSDTDMLQASTEDLSISESKLAAMLQGLRSSRKADLQTAVEDIRKEVHDIGARIGALEECTDELCLANNEGLFQALAPDLGQGDLRIDRAHHVPKPKNPEQDIPRAIIIRLDYYSSEEAVLTAQRKTEVMPDNKITLYADLAPTMARRQDFVNITICLRYNKIPYRWGFPT
ncbi:Hypothetical predicted protein [Pelobates cultripes]|uniref:Uncharacterized protein n=1 Tax=Pelobates cultripes TaxID=61616 RepID=A0AAD1VNV0_PELCU|nr:Hypothetical predicted protein [Pelobates cultripes]